MNTLSISSRLFSKEFSSNPYPTYKFLQKEKPLFYYSNNFGQNFWIATKYEDVKFIFTDKRFIRQFSSNSNPAIENFLYRVFGKMFLLQDPPRHTEMRDFFTEIFSSLSLSEIENQISSTAKNYLEQLKNKNEFDVISEYAFPLPYKAISNIMGLPEGLSGKIKSLSFNMLKGFDKTIQYAKELQSSNEAAKELAEIINQMIDHKNESDNDLTAKVIRLNKTKNIFNKEELISNIILILLAGHETTVSLIGSGIFSLIKNSECLILLKENPVLIKNIIEETLRFESPVQITYRVASEDIQLRNTLIKKNEQIAAVIGAANRDEEIFDHPEQFSLRRKSNKHLAFAAGNHQCLGSGVARLEGMKSIEYFFNFFNNHELSLIDYEWNDNFSFRGLKKLILHNKNPNKN